MGEQGVRRGRGAPSVPPSPALTRRGAHLEPYICGCSMSMHVSGEVGVWGGGDIIGVNVRTGAGIF